MSLYQQTEDLERLVMSPVKAMALGKEEESSTAGLTLLMEPGGTPLRDHCLISPTRVTGSNLSQRLCLQGRTESLLGGENGL